MSTRRGHKEGGIDKRGPDTFRLRYRVDGKRYAVTFHGPLPDARKELRRLLRDGDTDQHVAPDKVTYGQWAGQCIKAGAPGRRKKNVGRRTLQRYDELLKHHVIPTLGTRPLQKITGADISSLYAELESKVSTRTKCKISTRSALHVHIALGSCPNAAVRTGKLAVTPMARAMNIPSLGDDEAGIVLDADELATLVRGFRGSKLFPIVALAAYTGARRNEILALRWSDLDVTASTLRIERAIEETKKHGRVLKGPKRASHKRTIQIDRDLLELLVAERESYLRIKAGVPDGAAVDLSLVKLPDDALMFPAPPAVGESFSFAKLRCPKNITQEFQHKAGKLGFGPAFVRARNPNRSKLRLHDLRGSHETALLDTGAPVHVVAKTLRTRPRCAAAQPRKADQEGRRPGGCGRW